MDFDIDKIKQEQEDANDKKLLLKTIGNVSQGFADVPTAYELLKGKSLGPKQSLKSGFDAAADSIQDPVEKQMKTFQAYKAAKENEELKNASDPKSRRANAIRGAIMMNNPTLDPASLQDLTEKDLIAVHGDPGKLAEIQAQSAATFDREKRLKAIGHGYDMDKLSFEQRKKNDPRERLKGLAAGDKARYDNALMVLKGIDDMGSALDKGDDTFSMVGDNNYTQARTRAGEAFGRMQSGGAINKDEDIRFQGMLPGLKDTKEMQRKKLLDQRNEMISRLKTLGFTPEEAGYTPKQFKYGATQDELPNSANANGNKPKTVIQNGHTYTLNEQTGEYE